jgi:energy-coupling factor transport system ATP-binding protein
MKLGLIDARASRGKWSITANGTFCEGVHLVSGNVGAGKSTLALMMAGLLLPEDGTVVREGIRSCMISLQFPEHHLTGATVAEECRSWGLDSRSVLSEINLTNKQDCAPLALSRGELKRLHLACVLANKYDLLLLDEPFSSLDAREKERICEQLSRRTGGITILFTHEQTTFPRVDHIWEIQNGTLADHGEMPDALCRWQHAPSLIKKLINSGKCMKNISPADLLEAGCRT